MTCLDAWNPTLGQIADFSGGFCFMVLSPGGSWSLHYMHYSDLVLNLVSDHVVKLIQKKQKTKKKDFPPHESNPFG